MRNRIFSISQDRSRPDPRTLLPTAILILCIAFNSLVPRFSITQREFDFLSDIVRSQSSLICLFSFSSIPLKIVGDLFNEGRSLAGKAKREAPQREKGTAPGSDCSLICVEHRTLERTVRAVTGPFAAVPVLPALHIVSSSPGLLEAGPGGIDGSLVFLLLILFCVLFARSSLPGDAIRFFSNNGKMARPGFQSRVILFPGVNHARH